MTFAQKVRSLRNMKGWTANELAEKVGVSPRTIFSYESGQSYPRHMKTYEKLAKLLEVDVNYLRTEEEDFASEVSRQYGSRGRQQYERAITEVRKLFAGGELPREDEIAFITEVQQLFLDSKNRAKKYTPRKHKNDRTSSVD